MKTLSGREKFRLNCLWIGLFLGATESWPFMIMGLILVSYHLIDQIVDCGGALNGKVSCTVQRGILARNQ